MELDIFADWPGAPLTGSLVHRAIEKLSQRSIPTFISSPSASDDGKPLLQWATYDSIDHELTLSRPTSVLSSSYIIRKALIRKHFLHRCIRAYTTKYPDSSLIQYVPRTWDIEISYADELDELWSDELWDLASEIERYPDKWWILKPGMADRGMGIRLFKSKEALQRIFEEFEEHDSDESDTESAAGEDTNVLTSQLRHFVIQEYLAEPLLMDPFQAYASPEGATQMEKGLEGRKFHLRAYCIASGALSVYLYPRVLALFSSEKYTEPSRASDVLGDLDLRPHLTNTCLQGSEGEVNVRLLHELVGCSVLSGNDHARDPQFYDEDVASIMSQVVDALTETFKAALQMPVHFQPLPNAFELYGVDFLVSHAPPGTTAGRFLVKLLEFNSEPAIEMTGSRLRWILEDLFELIAKTCVEPFFSGGKVKEANASSGSSSALRECLSISLRG